MSFWRDVSMSAVVAGFVSVLVGFTSTAVIIFQAAQALNASPAETASWLWALGIAIGITTIGLSLRYRTPILTAWSTPGAALLVTSVAGATMPEAIGAFIVSGLLIVLMGITGWFERAMQRIPAGIASAMLAGVLLRFGMGAFTALQTQLLLAGSMIVSYLLLRRFLPRYAIVGVLLCGLFIAWAQGSLHLGGINLELAMPIWTTPVFTLSSIASVALPLFLVTMASQNVPGVTVLRANGYTPPISPIITTTGITTVLLAPFGAFAI
ncbi:MAG: benzoate/H(+) symporter BenE family transporter, partial [Deefgea sp.]